MELLNDEVLALIAEFKSALRKYKDCDILVAVGAVLKNACDRGSVLERSEAAGMCAAPVKAAL
jgi:hypothetical protein